LAVVDGREVYYRAQGAGPPCLLLHGWGVSSETFAGLGSALQVRFAVTAVDLPGFGWSAPPPSAWGSLDYARHVERFMQVMTMPSAHVLGHSFGGRVALALAAHFPGRVRRLVLVASGGIRPRRTARYYLRLGAARLAGRVLSPALWGRQGRSLQEALRRRLGSRDYQRAGAMRPTLVRLVNEDARELLPRVQAPTLIVWGSRDQEVPEASVRIMAQGLPGARLEIFEGAGHFPFADMPERFVQVVGDFWAAEAAA
jgi:pimeloyl-ACP methyl ester carboxylesterase